MRPTFDAEGVADRTYNNFFINLCLHFRSAFELLQYSMEIIQKSEEKFTVNANVKIKVKSKVFESKATGDGPINALDAALRKVLEDIYPQIKSIKLTDYKVRVLDSKEGTADRVRVIIESQDEEKTWGTVGVSTNVVEASYLALADSLEYKILERENNL